MRTWAFRVRSGGITESTVREVLSALGVNGYELKPQGSVTERENGAFVCWWHLYSLQALTEECAAAVAALNPDVLVAYGASQFIEVEWDSVFENQEYTALRRASREAQSALDRATRLESEWLARHLSEALA